MYLLHEIKVPGAFKREREREGVGDVGEEEGEEEVEKGASPWMIINDA